MKTTSSVLNRAKQLGAGTAVAATAVLATPESEANFLTLDYSFSAEYSNSGWFMQDIRHNEADGIVLSNGFKLWGEVDRTDSLFWEWDSDQQKTVPRSDVTGFAMAWGGRIIGPTTYDDVISAPYDFSVDFTHNDNDGTNDVWTYASTTLEIGYGTEAFTPEEYNITPMSNASNYNSEYFDYDNPGQTHHTGDISIGLEENDGTQSLFWFAMLSVEWGSEPSAYWNWDDNYTNLDGDTFKLTVPQNSIDVTFDPILAPDPGNGSSPVPDSGTYYAIYGILGLGLLIRARKR